MASTVRIGDLTVNRLGFGAMRVCGTNIWGPPKIYRRHAIVDEAMLKEGALKLQTLHDTQAPAPPVIPLTRATRTKRVSSSTVRVCRAHRERRSRVAHAKSLPAGEKRMVGWDGIEPPTPGFSDLGRSSRKYA
jgi:hypothetical protein